MALPSFAGIKTNKDIASPKANKDPFKQSRVESSEKEEKTLPPIGGLNLKGLGGLSPLPKGDKPNTGISAGSEKPEEKIKLPSLPDAKKTEETKEIKLPIGNNDKTNAMEELKNKVTSIQKQAKEEIKEEAKVELNKEAKEAPKKEVKEEVKEKATSKKAETKNVSKKEKSEAPDTTTTTTGAAIESLVTVPTNTFTNFEAAIMGIFTFNDPEWETFKKNITEEIDKLLNDKSDITPAKINHMTQKVNEIRGKLWDVQSDAQKAYQNLASEKPEGFIEQVKKINLIGANEDQRRRNAVLACMNYKTANGSINLYEVCAAARDQLTFVNSALTMCQNIASSCITMNNNITNEIKLDC